MRSMLHGSLGKKLCVLAVVATVSVYAVYRLLKTKARQGISYIIDKTWDGEPVKHDKIEVSLIRTGNAVEVQVKAPFMNNPPAPKGVAGEPFPQLWDYEVVEAFFLNDKDEYLEVELCPHGQHLVLMLRERRKMFKDKLPLSFISEKKNDHWSGRAFIPVDYFPPRVTKFNAYAIHGSGNGRTYEALYKVPGDEPDFHRLEFFEAIDFQKLVPENSSPSYTSSYWSS